MPNRDFEIEMKLKADFKSAQQALGETQDGIEAVTAAAGKANNALDKSSSTQSNRLREMVQRSIADLEAARAQVDTGTSTGGGTSAAQAAGVRELTAAQQAQQVAMAASQKAISAEIGLIGDLQARLSRGAASMDDLADTEARLDQAMSKGLITAEEYDDALAKLTKEQGKLDTAAAKSDKTLTTTVGRYDKASVGLARLARDEASLKAAVDSGRISREQYNRAMAAIGDERTRLTALRQGAEQSASAMSKLSLRTAESQRNLAQLVAYSASGQWQLAGSQVLQLGNSAGAATALFSPLGLAIGSVVGVLGGLVVAATAGYLQMRALDNAVIATGGSAGVTAGQLGDMRDNIGQATGEYGDAQKALAAFVGSGKFAGDALDTAASAAVNLSRITGDSIEQTTSQIIALAKSPTASLIELNDRYHFLTAEVYENVASLEAQGRAQEAAKLATQTLASVAADRAAQMVESAGSIERAYTRVSNAIAGAIQAAKNLGREDIEGQIQIAERGIRLRQQSIQDIREAQAQGGFFGLSKANGDSQIAGLQAVIDRQTKVLGQLKEQKSDQEELATGQAVLSGIQQEGVDAYGRIADGAKRAQTNAEKLAASVVQLKKDFTTLRNANPDSAQLADVLFGADGSIRGGQYDKQLKALQDQYKDKKQPKTDGQKVDEAAARELDNLQKQVALLADIGEGETKASEAARIRYEIEQGAYAKASPQRKQQLVDQAQLLDSERALREEQKKKDEAFKETKRNYDQLLDSLRTPAEVALDTAIAQVKTLNDAIKAGIALPADYTDSISRIGKGAIGDAPKVQGLAPEVGGAFSELTRIQQEQDALEKWNTDKLALIAAGRAAVGANQAVWDAADLERAKKHQDALNQIEQAKGSARLTMTSDFLGQIAQLQNSENSKAARIGKTAAIAQALINTYKSATEAYAAMAGIQYIGPALGVAAAAAAVAAGMAQVSAIRSVSTGYATGGHVRGPGTGTSDSINAQLSDYEFVTRSAVVRQPGALGFLEDFNDRGMSALYDWTSAKFADGGLATPAALAAPNWADMNRRQEAAANPTVNSNTRVLNFIDRDELARALADSREFEKTLVNTSINNGKKIRGGWGS